MIRIAHASARLRLSDVVEPEDVDRAVQLVELSIDQTMTDPDGFASPTAVETEPGSVTDLKREIKSVIKNEANGGIRFADFWDYFDSRDYPKSTVQKAIDALTSSGRIYTYDDRFRLS
jgi:Predicted ATPase involved in replication control, Cdc46/Mcm family